MNQILLPVLFLLFASIGFAQGPDIIEISGTGEMCNTSIFGTYTKHTGSISNDVNASLSVRGSYCECYNQEGSTNVLYFGYTPSSGEFLIVDHYVSGTPGNGCGTASNFSGLTTVGSRTTPTMNCDIDEFNFGTQGCLYEVTTHDIPPIPTLSQWGLILLFLALMILGVVALNYRKKIRSQWQWE